MNVFLTPQLEPFIGGTYWPPKDAFGRPGEQSQVLALLAIEILFVWPLLFAAPLFAPQCCPNQDLGSP